MKKLLSLVLVICMCLCMGACGNKDTSTDGETPNTDTPQGKQDPSTKDERNTDGSTDEPAKNENTTPYGLENAKEVVFYLPGVPKNTLSDSFLSWVTPHYSVGDSLPESVYGMYSFNDEAGFVGKKK